MLNEHDRDPSPEEGEYHFSDEGVYETPLEEEGKAAPATLAEKSSLSAQFVSYRRFIIMGGIFAGVLLVVYLVVAPPSSVPPTEFTQATTTTPAPTQALPLPTPEKAPAPQVAKAEIEQAKEATPPASPPQVAAAVEPSKAPPSLMEAPPLNAPPDAATQLTSALVTPPEPAAVSPMTPQQAASSPTGMPPSPRLAQASEGALLPDAASEARLRDLEQTNARMMNQMSVDFNRKITEYEVNNKAMQEQLNTMSSKISGMEVKLNQLMQTLNKQPLIQQPSSTPPERSRDSSENNPSFSLPPSPSSMLNPAAKSNYTVQAIIPGRAWLRTENGETVTVAEGDVLKGVGRVVKIDPYDGTIQIDTGSKMLLLTYGNGDYA